jgi:Universal stress protein family
VVHRDGVAAPGGLSRQLNRHRAADRPSSFDKHAAAGKTSAAARSVTAATCASAGRLANHGPPPLQVGLEIHVSRRLAEAAGRRYVVGVDGSEGSRAALRWAAAEAARHGAELEVVHAWQPPIRLPIVGAVANPLIGSAQLYPGPLAARAQEVLDRTLTDGADQATRSAASRSAQARRRRRG